MCCLVLRSNFALLLTIQFASLFFFFNFFFSATILSGTYLWNRYSQRLQIECAAWSCCLILHCCLPSNSLLYLFIFFFRHDFVRHRVFHFRGIAPRSHTGRPRTCLVGFYNPCRLGMEMVALVRVIRLVHIMLPVPYTPGVALCSIHMSARSTR